MRLRLLHPAALLPLAALALAAPRVCPSQIYTQEPTTPHPPQVNLHRQSKSEDLSWLTTFAEPSPGASAAANQGRATALLADPRFSTLLHQHLVAPQSFWNGSEPLPSVAQDFLAGPAPTVTLTRNRLFAATGSIASFPADRGLLWVDLGLPRPLLVFAAIDWISDGRDTAEPTAAYTLWLFPDRPFSASSFPPALRDSLATWTAQPAAGSTNPQNITRVFLIDPDGTPHPLAPSTAGAHNTLAPETTDDMKVPS